MHFLNVLNMQTVIFDILALALPVASVDCNSENAVYLNFSLLKSVRICIIRLLNIHYFEIDSKNYRSAAHVYNTNEEKLKSDEIAACEISLLK